MKNSKTTTFCKRCKKPLFTIEDNAQGRLLYEYLEPKLMKAIDSGNVVAFYCMKCVDKVK